VRRAEARDVLLATAAAGALVGLLAGAWAGLWAGAPAGRIAAVAALAMVPAVLRALPVRAAPALGGVAAALAAVLALAVAAHVSVGSLLRFDGGAWRTVARVLPDGLRAADRTPLPIDQGAPPALGALLIAVLAAAAALVAWQLVVRRRPLAALVAAGIGLAYRWTLVPPARPVLSGVLALVVVLAALALAARRDRQPAAGAGRAAPLVATVVIVAALLGAGLGSGGSGWWDWRSWSLEPGGTRIAALSLDQRYGRLDWPAKPTVLLRVRTDRGLPLRAAVLERFDGLAFAPELGAAGEPLATGGGRIRLPGTPSGEVVREDVQIVGAQSDLLFAGGRPLTVDGPFDGRRAERVGESIRVDPGLGPGDSYEVSTTVPGATPAALERASVAGAADETLATGTGVLDVPAWSTGRRLPASSFGPYAGVAELSRRVIAGARTPYEAVNRTESFLRQRYEYDETPPLPPPGTPPLVDFLLGSQRGFCQQFAGAMALMLRMNGIPARVAVGFTPGRFDASADRWDVLDRDAHSWVEVRFDGFGWLPFDPTPGRSAPNPASVSSTSYRLPPLQINQGSLSPQAVKPVSTAGTQSRDLARDRDAAAAAARGGSGDRPWLALLALALVLPALALLVAPSVKLVRRARRRRGDERARTLGAALELESLLADLGRAPDPSLTAEERAMRVRRELGVDAAAVYRLAAAARYAPRPPARGTGALAWRELARVRRSIALRRRMAASLRLTSLRHRPGEPG